MKITFLGHACFLFSDGKHTVLTDPFLTNNPQASARPGEVRPDYILVTHAHHDHLGDTYAIARDADSLVITTAEIAELCTQEQTRAHAMHIGGKRDFDFGFVRVTPAFHGSGVAGGHACGFIFGLGGKTVYFAGDTGLFGDMELLGRLEDIDVAILPIGDNFTMGMADAVIATKLLKPKVAVPMHYNTWPLIKADPYEWKSLVEAECPSTEVMIMTSGQNIEV